MKRWISPRLEAGILLTSAALISGAGWIFGHREPTKLVLAAVFAIVGARNLWWWHKRKDPENSN